MTAGPGAASSSTAIGTIALPTGIAKSPADHEAAQVGECEGEFQPVRRLPAHGPEALGSEYQPVHGLGGRRHLLDHLPYSCDGAQIRRRNTALPFPLLVMLRSAGRPAIRDQFRTEICEGYLPDFAERMGGENPALRAELVGALLLGMGVMRSLLDSPALRDASFEETRTLVARLVATLAS